VATSRFSRIFHGEGTAFAVSVAIKVFLAQQGGEAARDAARGYYAALTEFQEIAGDDRDIGVVEPLGVIEDHGIVITDGSLGRRWLA
jgi:hypothetical protein